MEALETRLHFGRIDGPILRQISARERKVITSAIYLIGRATNHLPGIERGEQRVGVNYKFKRLDTREK